jgi:LysR family carnitine catabolism transcriptional activator
MQVARSGSFSQTARLLHVSQPALSRTIRLLEEQLGQRLFDRDTRNVQLTTAGEALLPVVERLTADFDGAFAELEQDFAGRRGRVVIGALPSTAAVMLPRALASFLSDHPKVEILIRDDLSGALFKQLRERQVDFAIATPPDGEGFAFTPLYPDPYVLVCRADDPVMQEPEVGWSTFASHPYIAIAGPSSVRTLTDAGLARAGVTARPLFECAHLPTLAGLVEAGLGISAVPRSCLPLLRSAAVASREFTEAAPARMIGLAHLETRTLSPAADALMRHLVGRLGLAKAN